MIAFIEKYPTFITIRIDGEGLVDKRVLVVKPGEQLKLNDLHFSYDELRLGPQVILVNSVG